MSSLLSKLNNLDDIINPFEDDDSVDLSKINADIFPASKKKIDDKLFNGDVSVREVFDSEFGEVPDDFYDFDSALQGLLENEDGELKYNLLSMGRKYAKDNKIGEDESEVGRAFSPQELSINKMLKELDKDKSDTQKDIDQYRESRYKNGKILADLRMAKARYHDLTLSALKELSAIKKTEFDIQNKLKRDEVSDSNNDITVSSTLQKILGMGHSTLMESVGGRELVSGALTDPIDGTGENPEDMNALGMRGSDEYIEEKYLKTDGITEGDKFLQHENENIIYVLTIDSTGYRTVHAESENGEVVDYPLPSDINELDITIDNIGKTALDPLQREYIVRYINDDGVEIDSPYDIDE